MKNNVPTNVFMLTLCILFCFIFVTPTYANCNFELNEESFSGPARAPNNGSPQSNEKQKLATSSISPYAQIDLALELRTKSTPESSSATPDTKPTLEENLELWNTKSAKKSKPSPKSPHTSPIPGSKPNPKSQTSTAPKSPNIKRTPKSNSKLAPESTPAPDSNSKSPNAPTPKSPLGTIPESPNAPPPEEPKLNPNSPKAQANSTSPYQFANHFCLFRRLDVKQTFCLRVLRSSPSSTNATNNLQLLQIASNMAIQFGNKTVLLLKTMSKDTNTSSSLKPVIRECLSAYKGYIVQYQVLMQETKNNSKLGGYDAELAKIEINRCVKALTKARDEEIEAQNSIALDYTKLSQNIADSIAP